MADGDGYHPPQFSEEAAWLPPWLQPSQLPLYVDGSTKNDENLHPLGCEIFECHQGNVSNGQGTNVITKEDSSFFSCHLCLSGGDSSFVFSAHSSANVPLLHLHLSSEDISPISSGEFDDMHRIGASKLNRESIPELSVIQNEMDYEHNTRNGDHPANISAGECSMPSAPTTRGSQGNGEENKEVDGHLETVGIDDAVELTIAASEALVISEMTARVSHLELFNTAALLEVALRVKQARNDCHVDASEAVSSIPTDEHDETDQLHDLDDYTMADAFEDVGLPCNQIIRAPNGSFDSKVSTTKSQSNICNSDQGHHPYADDIYVPNIHLSEAHGCGVAQENGPRAQYRDIDAIALQEQLSHVSNMDSKLKQLPLQAHSVSHTHPSIHFPLNLDVLNTSNIKNQVRESIKSFQESGDDSASAENPSKGDPDIQDGEDIIHRDKKLRQEIPNFLHGETSFISESIDVPTDGNVIVRTPEAEPKIIAASGSLFEDLHRIPYDENEIHNDEDIVASCNLLEIDTLCSVVPCSLSSDNACVPHGHNQEGIEMEAGWCLKPTTKLAGLQNLEESHPIMVDAQRGKFAASRTREKGSTVTHMQFSSLRDYSVVTPAKRTFSSGKSLLLKEPIPPVSINENRYCIMPSSEEAAGILAKPATKSQNIHEQSQSWKNHVKAHRPSATAEHISASTEQILRQKEMLNKDVSPMVHQHADTPAPIILNTGARRRLQVCNTISLRQDESENPRISLPSTMKKSIRRKSSDEDHCRNKACVCAACFPRSSSHLHLLEEQYLPTKKVRFSEAEADIHYLPANQSEDKILLTKKVDFAQVGAYIHRNNSTHMMNCACQRGFHTNTNRKNKDSSRPYKSRTRKSNYNYLTSDFSENEKRRILQGLEFLLTGFSRKKKEEIETLIRRHGGLVLPDIPLLYSSMGYTDQQLPIVLSPRKVQTTKFLYGCAIKTWLLHNNWLSDSVQAGFILPPVKYLTLPNQISERKHLRIEQIYLRNSGTIFDKVGIMLSGKISFCAKFSKIIKFGGGRVFKALHWLVQSLKNGKNTVGAIVIADEINVSRHLKHCALEHDLYMMPASWIMNSLFSGKLLPCKKDRTAPLHRIKKPRFPQSDPVVCEQI